MEALLQRYGAMQRWSQLRQAVVRGLRDLPLPPFEPLPEFVEDPQGSAVSQTATGGHCGAVPPAGIARPANAASPTSSAPAKEEATSFNAKNCGEAEGGGSSPKQLLQHAQQRQLFDLKTQKEPPPPPSVGDVTEKIEDELASQTAQTAEWTEGEGGKADEAVALSLYGKEVAPGGVVKSSTDSASSKPNSKGDASAVYTEDPAKNASARGGG